MLTTAQASPAVARPSTPSYAEVVRALREFTHAERRINDRTDASRKSMIEARAEAIAVLARCPSDEYLQTSERG